MANQVVWVDIPCVELERAIRFYSAVLGCEVRRDEFPEFAIGILPHGNQEVGACLFVSPDSPPADHGPLVYFNCQGRLDAALEAVAAHGGKVIKPKHPIGPYGHRAIVLDSEGNGVALHSE